jgi:hypothetical protein
MDPARLLGHDRRLGRADAGAANQKVRVEAAAYQGA